MANTGNPWNLPSPDLPEQPHGPAQIGDLAESVHAALGRAVPCTSIARPTPTAGMLAYETDTDTLLYCPDGTNWRVAFTTPTVTNGVGGGTPQAETVGTASTGFTVVAPQRWYKTGGMVHFSLTVTRSGATITAGATGNITNTQMLTIAAGWRPPLGAWQVNGGGGSGQMMSGYADQTGVMAVGALAPGVDWTTGGSVSWGGSYPCGDG